MPHEKSFKNPLFSVDGCRGIVYIWRMNEMLTAAATAKVTIISIWSKWEGLEGKLRGRDQNFEYTVEVPVGPTPEATMDQAFILTNHDDRPHGNRCCSTTAGDIMVLDGQHYLVAGEGFTKLSPVQSEAIQKLTSRDTSFGLDFMVKHCNVPNA